jgi:hypothetical protein
MGKAMSVHVVSWVLRSSPETLGRRLVLLVLADHAREDGSSSWPAVETIAEQARLSRRQAQRALRDLESSGAITATGRSAKGTFVYSVNMSGRQYDAPPGGDIYAPVDVGNVARSVLEPSTTTSPIGEVARADDVVEHRPARDVVGNPPKAGDGDVAPVEAPPSTDVVVAGSPRTAQDLVQVVVDRFALAGVIVPPRHRGMIASQAKELLDAGMDFGDVVVAAIIAVRRGSPQHLHYIAGDVNVAKAGQRISRREYERELEDARELAGDSTKGAT